MKQFENYNAFVEDIEAETGMQSYDTRTSRKGIVLPYVVCLETLSNDVYADNTIWKKSSNIDMILHVDGDPKHKQEAMDIVENYLVHNGILYERTVDWLDSVQVFAITYSVEIYYVE